MQQDYFMEVKNLLCCLIIVLFYLKKSFDIFSKAAFTGSKGVPWQEGKFVTNKLFVTNLQSCKTNIRDHIIRNEFNR